MRGIKLLIMILSTTICVACDTADQMHQPRTMVIAGMPVYEHDYKLPDQSQVKPSTMGE